MFRGSAVIAAFIATTVAAITPRKLYAFPDGQFLENIAVRANGELLVSSLTVPRVYGIDPRPATPIPRTVVEFNATDATSVLGVAEYAPDQFAVLSFIFNYTTFKAQNHSVWGIDLRRGSAVVRKIANLPDAVLGNGLTVLPGSHGQLLASDSTLGALWGVNAFTGAVRLVEKNADLTPVAGKITGVNGIRAQKHQLYFTNSDHGVLARVPIGGDGTFRGPATALATLNGTAGIYDDFVIDRHERVWVATHPDRVTVVLSNGEQVPIVGFNVPTSATRGPSSVALGRGCKGQEQTLYVTTAFGVVYALDTELAL